MPVVVVWKVRVTVRQRSVAMRMAVWLRAVPGKVVRVLVVAVVPVRVAVYLRGMGVQVVVVLAQVQRHAGCHQQRRPPQPSADGLAQPQHRERRTHERCG